MRMKMVCDDRTLREVANEFLALKKAQKVRERTLNDYKKYIDKFLEQSQNSLDVGVLKIEIMEYFADIPKTSPARFNHPYQYLHALFAWAAKQDYIPYNPFEKLELKKVRDEGNVQPAEIRDIQTLLKALDKHNYTELRDYNIVLSYFVKEADGNFHYSYYGVVDRVMAEYVNPQGIEGSCRRRSCSSYVPPAAFCGTADSPSPGWGYVASLS